MFLYYTYGFYNSAKDQIDVLVEMHKNMTTMFKELVEYFCLDIKKTSMEEFFGDIKTLLDHYEVVIVHSGWMNNLVLSVKSCFQETAKA